MVPSNIGAFGCDGASAELMAKVYKADDWESCAICTRGSIALVTGRDLCSRTRLRLAVSRAFDWSELLCDV